LRAERDVAASAAAAQELTTATKEARRLRQREVDLRADFGEAFGRLAELSNELMATLAARGVLVDQVKRAELPRSVGIFDREAVGAWEAAIPAAVEPAPKTFKDLIQEALAVTTGPRTSVEDPETLRELNR